MAIENGLISPKLLDDFRHASLEVYSDGYVEQDFAGLSKVEQGPEFMRNFYRHLDLFRKTGLLDLPFAEAQVQKAIGKALLDMPIRHYSNKNNIMLDSHGNFQLAGFKKLQRNARAQLEFAGILLIQRFEGFAITNKKALKPQTYELTFVRRPMEKTKHFEQRAIALTNILKEEMLASKNNKKANAATFLAALAPYQEGLALDMLPNENLNQINSSKNKAGIGL